jgi:hypothetical protein
MGDGKPILTKETKMKYDYTDIEATPVSITLTVKEIRCIAKMLELDAGEGHGTNRWFSERLSKEMFAALKSAAQIMATANERNIDGKENIYTQD